MLLSANREAPTSTVSCGYMVSSTLILKFQSLSPIKYYRQSDYDLFHDYLLLRKGTVYELTFVAIGAVVLGLCLLVWLQKGTKAKDALLAENTQKAGLTRVLPVGMLIAKSGIHRGLVFAIDPTGVKIGRDKSQNQIVIDSEIVSREHAWIGLEDGKVVLKDLGSLNGTYINSLEGARIQTIDLKDGDVIFIGKNGTESFKYKTG